MLCAWASIDERGKASGGKAGDQTGREVRVGSWYNFNYSQVLRWKDPNLAKKYAKIVKEFAENDCIGYDQSQRTTLFSTLKKSGWNYLKVNSDVECDCSELVACAVNCTVGKEVVPSYTYTGNLKTLLMNTGLFDLYTGSKYCSSSSYLCKGDILNAPCHHVISAIENGNKASVKSSTKGEESVAEPTLSKGKTGSQVKKLQCNLNKALKISLATDGIFGTETRSAVKKFQTKYGLVSDGVYGAKTYAKMKSVIG